ncbi:MAG: hypothetical protein R3E51_00775 [Rhizobiaceae bacterium]
MFVHSPSPTLNGIASSVISNARFGRTFNAKAGMFGHDNEPFSLKVAKGCSRCVTHHAQPAGSIPTLWVRILAVVVAVGAVPFELEPR